MNLAKNVPLLGCILWLCISPLQADPPTNPKNPNRDAILAERDALTQAAMKDRRVGDFDSAQDKLQKVYEFERSVFGDAHEELLGTLDLQAQVAESAGNLDAVIKHRRAAQKIGQVIYAPDDYQLTDLSLALQDAIDSQQRSPEEREQLVEANRQGAKMVAAYREGNFAEAIGIAERIKGIKKMVLGREHPEYAIFLNNMAILHGSMGDYAKAESLHVKSNAIIKKELGREHPEYAAGLNNLAGLYDAKGEYAQAEPLLLEAKAIVEKVFGCEHPDYANSLNNLGGLYSSMGAYSRAEPLYLEAKAIVEKVIGREYPEYAICVSNLAFTYQAMGDYGQAESLYLEAKAVEEKVLGREHPNYADTLNNLAGLYSSMGEVARAETLYLQARAILKKVLGCEHRSYANSISSLARLYRSMSEFARAKSLQLEAKAIRKKLLGCEHPEYADSLNNLARLHDATGDHAEAESLYLEAKAIVEKVHGREHPFYATCLNNLAGVYDSTGKYSQAESLYLEAKSIQEKVLGREHPSYASSLNNLAMLYSSKEEYARAKALFLEAKSIREKVLGSRHPDYAVSLNNLAGLCGSMCDYARAEALAIEAVRRTLDYVDATSATLPQSRQSSLGRSVRYQLDNLVSLVVKAQLEPDAAIRLAARWKGSMLLRARARRLLSGDPAVADSFKQLRSVSARYARLIRKPPESSEDHVARRDELERFSEEIETLEKQIVAKSNVAAAVFDPPTLEAILESIPIGAVLVDFLDYVKDKEDRSLAASIIASHGPLKLLDLGSSKAIAELVDRWRTSFGEGNDAKEAGRELRKLVWQPIEQAIGDAELVLVSPDGPIGRMPLSALPGKRPGTYLIEERSFVRIPVPGLLPQLLKPSDKDADQPYDLLLMGDVDYDAGSEDDSRPKRNDGMMLASTRAASGESIEWGSLKGAAIEMDEIDQLYSRLRGSNKASIVRMRGGQATEARFEELAPKSRQLHLATHGFFADPSRMSIRNSGGDREAMQRFTGGGSAASTVVGYRPGLLSGLVMAGANVPPESIEDEDGILTAEEIAYLPMGDVELAVLSACETGLGASAGGEGITGIQRAFQVSGVDTTVASLWKVDDDATRKLMKRFYENREEKKFSAIKSLRQAQLWMLDQTPATSDAPDTKSKTDRGPVRPVNPVARVRSDRTPPRYWAAFTLSGDWR
ncbi:MAG: CHAT domain-containing tetratricopeptide repeat protein [Planctomycetota bacterium]